jgi:hypothetical protein
MFKTRAMVAKPTLLRDCGVGGASIWTDGTGGDLLKNRGAGIRADRVAELIALLIDRSLGLAGIVRVNT